MSHKHSNTVNTTSVWVEEVQAFCLPILNSKSIRLSTTFGVALPSNVSAYELENPYTIVITGFIKSEVDSLHRGDLVTSTFRVDISRDDIARELRSWLDGKEIPSACFGADKRVENNMMKYIKFGNIPPKENLIIWILSRLEITEGPAAGKLLCYFGGRMPEDDGMDLDEMLGTEFELRCNPFKETVKAATGKSIELSPRPVSQGKVGDFRPKFSTSVDFTTSRKDRQTATANYRHSMPAGEHDRMYNSYAAARSMLGKSQALEQLPHTNTKGREGAAEVLRTHELTSDHYRLGAFIERSRKGVEKGMEERRKVIEVAKSRQIQMMEHYREIRESRAGAKSANDWLKLAEAEVDLLKKVEADVEEDILKQRVKAHRLTMRARWQMNPVGTNLGGKSKPGPYIGPGPLPAAATSNLKDPAIEVASEKYYWDKHGRRHIKEPKPEDATILERALQAIKMAASNSFVQSLDIKKVFEEIDSSGNGRISENEMVEGLAKMGVQLDSEASKILFQHFDANGSGAIHYGEFVWAFFNRRSFMRQWRRNTKEMSNDQIRAKFHEFDINGDGRLNCKEFNKVLRSFGITLHQLQIKTLMDRFDANGDGNINLHEFIAFVHERDQTEESFVKIGKQPEIMFKPTIHSYTAPPFVPPEKYLPRKKQRPKTAPVRKKIFGHYGDTHILKADSTLPLPEYQDLYFSGRENSKQDQGIKETKHPRSKDAPNNNTGKNWTSTTHDVPADGNFITVSWPMATEPETQRSISDIDIERIHSTLRAQKVLEKNLGGEYYGKIR